MNDRVPRAATNLCELRFELQWITNSMCRHHERFLGRQSLGLKLHDGIADVRFQFSQVFALDLR